MSCVTSPFSGKAQSRKKKVRQVTAAVPAMWCKLQEPRTVQTASLISKLWDISSWSSGVSSIIYSWGTSSHALWSLSHVPGTTPSSTVTVPAAYTQLGLPVQTLTAVSNSHWYLGYKEARCILCAL